MIPDAEIAKLNDSGIPDFMIESFEGDRLVIAGSTDLAYYRLVTLTFHDVGYLQLPVYFNDASFRAANSAEMKKIRKLVAIEQDEFALKIVADGNGAAFQQDYFVTAARLEIGFQTPTAG